MVYHLLSPPFIRSIPLSCSYVSCLLNLSVHLSLFRCSPPSISAFIKHTSSQMRIASSATVNPMTLWQSNHKVVISKDKYSLWHVSTSPKRRRAQNTWTQYLFTLSLPEYLDMQWVLVYCSVITDLCRLCHRNKITLRVQCQMPVNMNMIYMVSHKCSPFYHDLTIFWHILCLVLCSSAPLSRSMF